MRFSVTLTVSPKWYRFVASEQYDHTHERVCDVMADLGIHRYTVVAELTRNANIHYHLSVEAPGRSELQFNKQLKDTLRKSEYFGFSVVKQILQEPQWTAYMAKSTADTSALINRPSVIRDDLSYFDDVASPIKATF